MFTHPLSISGAVVFFIGWCILLFGSTVSVSYGQSVLNFHTALIAVATILSGMGIAIAGIIAGAVHMFQTGVIPAFFTSSGDNDQPTFVPTEAQEHRNEKAKATQKEIDRVAAAKTPLEVIWAWISRP